MRHKGRLVTWDDERGFGFIAPEGGDMQVFVHISAFSDPRIRPVGGESLTYELGADERGRPRALEVVLPGAKPLPRTRSRSTAGYGVSVGGAVALLLGLGVATRLGWTSWPVAGLYLGMSLVAFLLYAWDKRAARRDEWRTPELRLHLVALLGGWPGALVAQRVFRHKSSKASFQAVFWITVAVNGGALVWLHTGNGQAAMGGVVGQVQRAVSTGQALIPSRRTDPTSEALREGVYKCTDAQGATLYSDQPCRR